ncbi:ABC transporter permease [Synoicihabitans lomoniglobus]|uniref:Transport permease protein n=1 Tax=Synoicihabitans lomoniglobus TaxID=2909285 RepID=A0AAF0CSX8_9BACT|nr:ABC transporter permease [Opitutaceae bacterium LMO-M01]WED67356.1 ABC transporter permease [Opitutaceae bacterium LMO-M01]
MKKKRSHLLSVFTSYRELLWQFTVRNLQMRHQGSYLGIVWSVLNPLLMVALYVFVFGYVFGGSFNTSQPESRVAYALTVFLGLTIYGFVGEVMGFSVTSIISQPNLVKKVVFPMEILPTSAVWVAAFNTLISLLLVGIGLVFLGDGLPLRALWLPVVLLPLGMMMLGGAWLGAAIGVFFRDVGQTIGFLNMVVMFSSGVFYPVSAIPEAAWAILRFNPLLLTIHMARECMIWNEPFNPKYLAYTFLVGFGMMVTGHWVFQRLKSAFADVV